MGNKVKMTDRLYVYRGALNFIQERLDRFGIYYMGLCNAMHSYSIRRCLPDPYFCMKDYPEINRFKPNNVDDNDYWFPEDGTGTQMRVNILNTAIFEIETKLKKNKKKWKP